MYLSAHACAHVLDVTNMTLSTTARGNVRGSDRDTIDVQILTP